MALSQAQLNDLNDTIVRKNNRNLIDATKLGKVLHEIIEAIFNAGGFNMANHNLNVEEDLLHNGAGHFWGIQGLAQFYISNTVAPESGASINLQGYGTGVDNPIFQLRNGVGSNAIYTTGDLRTVFGGNIAVGTTTNMARITGSTSSSSEYGIYGISQSNIGVKGLSENGIGVSGESENNYGIMGVSSFNIGLYGVSAHSTGIYAQSTNYIAIQALSGSNRVAVLTGNTPYDAVQITNSNTGGSGIGLTANSTGGNIGVHGVGGNFGMVGEGITGGYFYSLGGGFGIHTIANLGTGALKTNGKVVMESLPTSGSIANELYIYNDGTRKYLCIN